MRILLTNLTLATRTGTEIVTRDLAVGFVRAGHETCVFSPLLGSVAAEIADAGVPVVSRLDEVPFRPDIIHGQHHVETTVALLHFRSVPAIFVCHDRLNWHDTPPRLDAVRRYVAVDRNCLERLVIEAGVPEERTRVILNAVDLRRFRPRRPLPEKPARALAFSNYITEGPDLDVLRQACEHAGVRLKVAGRGVDAQAIRPEEILPGYDLVFAKGRCALEALAVGCAVILYDPHGLGPMLTSGEFQELRDWNLGMRCLQRRPTREAIEAEIARYDPADAARVAELVRASASVDSAVAAYLKVYKEALAEGDGVCSSAGDAVETLARKVGSLESVFRAAREPFAMAPLPRHVVAEIGIRVSERVSRIAAGASAQVSVEIENRSSEVLATLAPYPVQVSYHWLESGTRGCVVFDGDRTPLSTPVRPRSRHWQQVRVLAPEEPGRYVLVLTLVQEGQFWFDGIQPPAGVEWEVTVDRGDCRALGPIALSDVAAWTSARVVRDAEFANLGFVSDPMVAMLTFVEARPFLDAALAWPRTSCVLARPELIGAVPERIGLAVADDPKRCFFEIHNRLAAETDFYGHDFASRIHPTARLHPRCWVDEKNVVIEAGVTVGPNASVLQRATVAEGTVIHAGAVIGSAGFQSSRRQGDPVELAHAGAVEIGPACHIFANAVIARGLFRQSTQIGRACRVGNGAFVSHNCLLGDEVFVGHGAVVNGNVRVGANAWIGPGATILNGIGIGPAAQVSLGATVIRNVDANRRVTGSLAIEHRKMLRLMADAEKGRQR